MRAGRDLRSPRLYRSHSIHALRAIRSCRPRHCLRACLGPPRTARFGLHVRRERQGGKGRWPASDRMSARGHHSQRAHSRRARSQGVLWSSRQMTAFIVALICMFVLSTCYLVLEIGSVVDLHRRALAPRLSHSRHAKRAARIPQERRGPCVYGIGSSSTRPGTSAASTAGLGRISRRARHLPASI